MRQQLTFATYAGIAVLILGCKSSPAPRPHASLSSIAPLRTAFNADSGKVRAIFLASPT